MSYDPATDFLGLLRLTAGGVRSERMPGLDYVAAALARSGLITLYAGQSEPVVNQPTTVWLKPAQPSWVSEGTIYIWSTAAAQYEIATPALWSLLLAGVAPGNDEPLMNGVETPGTSPLYSREDHVHPTDTSLAPLISPGLLGDPTAPTQPLGDASTKLATTQFVITNGGLPPPIGSILPYAGSAPPSANWAIAVGQAFSRTGTTAALFAALGITFGSGDGITTFNGPDLRGRVVAGVDGGANRLTTATMSSQALAGVGGTETHILTQAELSVALGSATSVVTDPGHTHNLSINGSGTFSAGPLGITGAASQTNAATTGITVATTITNSAGGNAHVNVQPTIELNYIIRIS